MKGILTVLAGVAAWLLSTTAAPAKDKNEIPAAVVKLLEKGGKLEVFYLKDEEDQRGFRNYKVVGDPVELKDEKSRKKLVDALVKGVAEVDLKQFMPKDFENPSQGLRVTGKDGKQTDILISYASSWGFIYNGDEIEGQFRITVSPKETLNSFRPK